MVFLMMAAHDTTTSASDFLDYDELDSLTLSGAAFKEALRMKPPLAIIPRVATTDIEYAGFQIAKDEVIQICPIFTHYSPDIWKNPKQFDPKRFLPPCREDLKHRYAYIPFGGGAHKCLGMHFSENQAKTILFHLLKSYEIQVSEPYSPIWKKVPIIQPLDGLPVTLKAIR